MSGGLWRAVLGVAAAALLVQTVFIAAPDARAASSSQLSLTRVTADGTRYSLTGNARTDLGYVPGQAIVEFAAGTSAAAMRQAAVAAGAEAAHVSPAGPLTSVHVGRSISYAVIKSRSMSAEQLVAKFRGLKGVVAVSLDYIRKADGLPNDPKFAQEWGLRNTGQDKGLAGADIDVATAWNYSTGSKDVVVADMDTGVYYLHPDLAPNMWHNPNEIAGDGKDNDANGYIDDIYGMDASGGDGDPMDEHGHGTHTSGIIAAAGNNGVGVSGVGWSTKIMALRFLDAYGYGSDSEAIRCIDYLIRMKDRGVNVVAVNASWGGGEDNAVLKNAIATLGDAGVIWCAAAGNYGNDNDEWPEFPASWDLANIVSVAATDRLDRLTEWSSFGHTTVDLGAPGEEILSTIPDFTIGPALFADDMESGAGNWTATAPWAITTEMATSPTHSWSDSPGGAYANNRTAALTSKSIDASGVTGAVALTYKLECVLDEMSEDVLLVEASGDGGATWEEVDWFFGSGGEGEWYPIQDILPKNLLTKDLRIRFVLHTDAADTADGVHIDDVRVSTPTGGYEEWDGTSMATPFVAGTVGLLAAISPTSSVDNRVDALLSTTDPLPSLRGKCVTGGRLNAGAAAKWLKQLPPLSMSTLAGKANSGGHVDGQGAAARFSYPQGICADPVSGDLYVADWNNHTIRKVTPTGRVTTIAGSAGKQGSADGTGSAARFSYPSGLCFDPIDGALYVADRSNHVIRRVTKTGVVTTIAGSAGKAGAADGKGAQARFDLPTGICFNASDGNLYVTDQGNATIRRVTPQGTVGTAAGRPGTTGSTDGARSTGRLDSPAGICYDPVDQCLYFTESRMNTVRRMTPGGALSTIAGTAGQTGSINATGRKARFSSPVDICYNPGDRKLYVVDSGNDLIRQVTTTGVVKNFVGVAGVAKSVDGQGGNVRLCYPRSLCYSPATGRLYDTEDSMVVRQIIFGQKRAVAPGVSLGSAVLVWTGAPFTLTSLLSDRDSVRWWATVDYGDGTGVRALAVAADRTLKLAHVWPKAGSYTVKVTVRDDSGLRGAGTLTVSVKNKVPLVLAGANAIIREGGTFAQTGSFVDTGAGPWTATVDYGDGTGPHSLTLTSSKSFRLSRVYKRAGEYTITVRVSDGLSVGSDTVVVGASERYQQSNASLNYAGTWKTVSAAGASDGSYKQAGASGAAVAIAFSGRSFDLVARKGPDCGIAKIRLDGGAPVYVDLYAAAPAFQRTVWSTGFMTHAPHTVRVEWTGQKRAGATGANINLDAFFLVGALR